MRSVRTARFRRCDHEVDQFLAAKESFPKVMALIFHDDQLHKIRLTLRTVRFQQTLRIGSIGTTLSTAP